MKKMRVLVCGTELVEMSNSSFSISNTYYKGNGTNNVVTFTQANTVYFNSTVTTCPVTSTTLKTMSGSVFSTYTGSVVSLNSNYDVLISTATGAA